MSLAPAVGAPANCGSFAGEDAPASRFSKGSMASTRFFLRATQVPRILSPSEVLETSVQDRNVTRSVGDTLITDYAVNVEYLVPDFAFDSPINVESQDETILLPPESLIAQGVSPGRTILKATAPGGEFAATHVTVRVTSGSVSDAFKSYVQGSAARNVADAIDLRIADKDASSKPIFSTQNHSAGVYVRNAACWAADLDLTCISPWNSTGGSQRAGTLISPRHVLFCEHLNFHPNPGASIRFVAADNTVTTRTITALETHPDYSPYYPDITIGVLDSDVPNTISFARILPGNWPRHFPSLAQGLAALPALALDQEEKALISELSSSSNLFNIFVAPTDPKRAIFFERIVTGDSGNPAFLIINDQLVVLNTWTYGGAGTGTNLVPHKDAINTMMTSLGGGYQLTEVDLGDFPSY